MGDKMYLTNETKKSDENNEKMFSEIPMFRKWLEKEYVGIIK